MKVELSDYELELISGALREQRLGLTNYVSWINDRPLLPDREVAVAKINDEVKTILSLQVKLYDARKHEPIEIGGPYDRH